jgi:hypothetical protein
MSKLFAVKTREHAEALLERDRLLFENPKLTSFQRQIDEMLDKAGSDHNRLVVIHNLMIEHMRKLAEELRLLIANLK